MATDRKKMTKEMTKMTKCKLNQCRYLLHNCSASFLVFEQDKVIKGYLKTML